MHLQHSEKLKPKFVSHIGKIVARVCSYLLLFFVHWIISTLLQSPVPPSHLALQLALLFQAQVLRCVRHDGEGSLRVMPGQRQNTIAHQKEHSLSEI